MPSQFPLNEDYNFIDMLSHIKHYRVNEDQPNRVNKLQVNPLASTTLLLDGYRLCEPFVNKYKLEMYGITGQNNAQYWLVHFDRMAEDNPAIADKIEIIFEVDRPFVFYDRLNTTLIRLEIKNVVSAGLTVGTIQAICVEY